MPIKYSLRSKKERARERDSRARSLSRPLLQSAYKIQSNPVNTEIEGAIENVRINPFQTVRVVLISSHMERCIFSSLVPFSVEFKLLSC